MNAIDARKLDQPFNGHVLTQAQIAHKKELLIRWSTTKGNATSMEVKTMIIIN